MVFKIVLILFKPFSTGKIKGLEKFESLLKTFCNLSEKTVFSLTDFEMLLFKYILVLFPIISITREPSVQIVSTLISVGRLLNTLSKTLFEDNSYPYNSSDFSI